MVSCLQLSGRWYATSQLVLLGIVSQGRDSVAKLMRREWHRSTAILIFFSFTEDKLSIDCAEDDRPRAACIGAAGLVECFS